MDDGSSRHAVRYGRRRRRGEYRQHLQRWALRRTVRHRARRRRSTLHPEPGDPLPALRSGDEHIGMVRRERRDFVFARRRRRRRRVRRRDLSRRMLHSRWWFFRPRSDPGREPVRGLRTGRQQLWLDKRRDRDELRHRRDLHRRWICAADCYVGTTLYPAAALNPSNACQVCTPSADTKTWSGVAAGVDCATSPDEDSQCDGSGACLATSTYSPVASPDSFALDGAGNVWVAFETADDAGYGSVASISPAGAVSGPFTVGVDPSAIAIDRDGNAWVTNSGDGTVSEVTRMGTARGPYSVGTSPIGIACDSLGNVWVAVGGDDSVVELSPAGALLATYQVGSYPSLSRSMARTMSGSPTTTAAVCRESPRRHGVGSLSRSRCRRGDGGRCLWFWREPRHRPPG